MASTTCGAETASMSDRNGTCPTCRQGDLIAISMTVGDRDLRFTTCHLCEAKWWFQEGELVPLTSVIDLVVKK
jgi:formate dehydrogenase maturation protein FdhE